jgi:hypothetical protein
VEEEDDAEAVIAAGAVVALRTGIGGGAEVD